MKDTISLFVARASAAINTDEKKAWLLTSLDPVVAEHEHTYGTLGIRSLERFVFVHSSNRPWPKAGYLMDRFELLFKQALEQDCEILLVVAGWDGLTTHQGTFQRLFYRAIDLNVAVRLRIYADDVNNCDEEKFYDVDPNEACAIMAGDLDAEDENFPSFASTRLFVEKFDIIHSAKVIQAIGKRLANEHTYQRNVHKGWDYNRRGYVCGIDGCLEILRNSVLRAVHRNHKHYEFKNEEDRKAALNCRYCEKSFSRKDARDRHEKICPKNPAISRDPKPKAPAPKRRYLKIEEVPSGSDNGPKVYDQLNAEDAKLLPRIDPADAVIYHHEKYCRYPGCEYPIRHDRMPHLRQHYWGHHKGFEWRKFSTTLGAEGRRQHAEGLKWLARCVFLKEVVGEAPRPTFY